MKTLSLVAAALVAAACATAPGGPPPKLVTICMPCGNACEFPCKPETLAATFDPPQGYYSAPPAVKLSSKTLGARIHYTTDGSEPTAKSPVYSAPIPVQGKMTLKALAIAPGLPPSEVASGEYIVPEP